MTSDSDTAEERLLGLVRRELGACEVSVESAEYEPSPSCIVVPLTEDRSVVARFETLPGDASSIARRMSILVSAFAHLFDREARQRHPRVPAAQSLRGELAALARRAKAVDAIVIDGHSPVVWGSGRDFEPPPDEPTEELAEVFRLLEVSRGELLALAREELEATGLSDPPPANTSEVPPDATPVSDEERADALTLRALEAAREHGEYAELRRGRPLRHRQIDDDLGWLAHSFAGIYLLLVIFDGRFDEIRAERAVHESLPRIERLVLALPPRDPSPTPMGKVIRLSRRR